MSRSMRSRGPSVNYAEVNEPPKYNLVKELPREKKAKKRKQQKENDAAAAKAATTVVVTTMGAMAPPDSAAPTAAAAPPAAKKQRNKSAAKTTPPASPSAAPTASADASSSTPIVHAIKDTCPIRAEVYVGDKLVAVDGIDVREMEATDVSKLIGSKSGQSERKLTIIRSASKGY